MITRRKTVFPGFFGVWRLRIEPSFNGRLRHANDPLGNTVFLSAFGVASNGSVSPATRTLAGACAVSSMNVMSNLTSLIARGTRIIPSY